MNIYCITFEHPDHGIYYKNIATNGIIDTETETDHEYLQNKLNIYNEIKYIELVVDDVIKL